MMHWNQAGETLNPLTVIMITSSLLLGACGGGASDGDDGLDGLDGFNALVAMSPEPAGTHCSTGGLRVDSGIDANGDDTLDVEEIRTTRYVCDGDEGVTGADGVAALVAMTDEPVGANCANGGVRVDSGLDANTNGVLDAVEITSSEYVCDGPAGAAGLEALVILSEEGPGVNCASGGARVDSGLDLNENGVLDAAEITVTEYVCDGATGVDGLQTLVALSAEPAGIHCAGGGTRVDAGADDNDNGILDPVEVTATDYICDGSNWWEALGQTGAIEGRLLRENGVPAEGAVVAISGTLHYAYTDRFGKYRFDQVAVGKQELLFSLDGYHPQTLNSVSVTADKIFAAREIRLNKRRTPFAEVAFLENVLTSTGAADIDFHGGAVAGVRDVNGDGLDDVLIAAPRADAGGNADAGEVRLVYGRAGMDQSALRQLPADVIFSGKTIDDRAGNAVAGAGDVNGDGFADLLIAAALADGGGQAEAGEIYLIYGGANLAANVSLADADVTFSGKASGDEAGNAIAGAGDVNGDGYDDFLIGAAKANINAGESYFIFGSAALAGTVSLANADVTLIGKVAGDASGFAVSGAGDFNGDGFADLLIGAPRAGPGGKLDAGESYLIYGSATLPATMGLATANVTFEGKAVMDDSGQAIAGVGDVNGDGFDDILIGAWNATFGGQTSAGEVYLIQGRAGLSGAMDLLLADATFGGKIANHFAGFAVAGAGDVDGDGFDDMLIGARHSSVNTQAGDGEAFLVHGGLNLAGEIGLARATAVFPSKAGSVANNVSMRVSSGGDINGDGYADLLIGSPGASSVASLVTGEAYLVMGRARERQSEQDFVRGARSLDTADSRIMGAGVSDTSGRAVASAGDFNGDGFDDFLIGAYEPGTPFPGQGRAYLIYGRAGMDSSMALGFEADVQFTHTQIGSRAGWAVAAAGDVNADGYDDILIGAHGTDVGGQFDAGESYLIYGRADLSGAFPLQNADVKFQGVTTSDDTGYALDGAGDVNGDGYDDIFIGAPGAGPQSEGEAYVIFGGDALAAEITLDQADVTLRGKAAGDNVGNALSGAGDVNGDGYADLLVGAFFADPGDEARGETYLVLGRADLAGLIDLANADVTLLGKNPFDFSGESVSGGGDVNGDGFDDILIGAPLVSEAYLIYGAETLPANMGLAAADATFSGKTSSDSGGWVSHVGDVDGDGFEDLLIGARFADPAAMSNAGESYLFYGRVGLTGAVSVATADASFSGRAGGDQSGRGVAGAGDVNGDGLKDLLIGAGEADPAGLDRAGESYLILGRGRRTP